LKVENFNSKCIRF